MDKKTAEMYFNLLKGIVIELEKGNLSPERIKILHQKGMKYKQKVEDYKNSLESNGQTTTK